MLHHFADNYLMFVHKKIVKRVVTLNHFIIETQGLASATQYNTTETNYIHKLQFLYNL